MHLVAMRWTGRGLLDRFCSWEMDGSMAHPAALMVSSVQLAWRRSAALMVSSVPLAWRRSTALMMSIVLPDGFDLSLQWYRLSCLSFVPLQLTPSPPLATQWQVSPAKRDG